MKRHIITISREFGSGGRELARRLAEGLGIAYYDREIVTAVAEKSGLAVEYIDSISERSVGSRYPITFGHTLAYQPPVMDPQLEVLSQQRQILLSLAEKGDCVIVGRCADVILREYNPLNIFVYADKASKLARCRARAPQDEHLSDNELARRIARVDKERARYRATITETKWGERAAYHLCVNTTGWEIPQLVKSLLPYANAFLER